MKNEKRVIGHADFHILLALFDADRHGYGIMKEVTAITDGALDLGPGTLYGAIRRLLREGLIDESGKRSDADRDDDRRTCYYRITRSGRRVAIHECQRVADLMRVAITKGALVASSSVAPGAF